MKPLITTALLFVLQACTTSHQHQLIMPDKSLTQLSWTAEETGKPIAVRTLFRNASVSQHLVRLSGAEPPHVHDRHSLSVTVLSGQSRIHFSNRSVDVSPGDTLFIPQGQFHWAENTGHEASIISATFSPAFDGKDRRIID